MKNMNLIIFLLYLIAGFSCSDQEMPENDMQTIENIEEKVTEQKTVSYTHLTLPTTPYV
jgi:hypothetical protein